MMISRISLLLLSCYLVLTACSADTTPLTAAPTQAPQPTSTPILASTLPPEPTATPEAVSETLPDPSSAETPMSTSASTPEPEPTAETQVDWLAVEGQTAEGYAYRGNPDAPIAVTDFSDFL